MDNFKPLAHDWEKGDGAHILHAIAFILKNKKLIEITNIRLLQKIGVQKRKKTNNEQHIDKIGWRVADTCVCDMIAIKTTIR